jgi:hypothetical protein
MKVKLLSFFHVSIFKLKITEQQQLLFLAGVNGIRRYLSNLSFWPALRPQFLNFSSKSGK